MTARTHIGRANAALAEALTAQERVRNAEARADALERENRDLRQRLAAAEMCIGKRGTIGDLGE